ncbi:nucleotide exchange factor GrpE [Lactobacillus delbrueckii subsp. bulgaricus]|uniref:nucleotide exchange factor GrpE n=1 Tax=Lactobacillus delbrueckii TaxID=1584 RepID=UPI0011C79717|nr:nucleotide exchange factor GrpE [Lactobacillus delbrueckii]MBT8847820.1 nucleotide exchange factor GrpE [Lactobacillus delbrueckii subsp. bulgaricus]MBT8852426.1 nucleotide exchange factor GrpE [Lactobacillus delbrueckii subsp. bulgaricus]MBT8853642.1 nucleotide exchange factor GrpE [Lactobacillus delbrueckii subsp. bulgaricus]MBT8855318.1 nucleotide exchange factor GrpE [Lactobacillus delbrueckii subsp. bulgaricus]MBT8857244.1 nucleotide exchange factor GrpE [Lactobacillus delbrueckii subs
MSKEEFPSEKDLPQEDQEKQAKAAEADKAGVKDDKKVKDDKEEVAKLADVELDQLKAEVAALTQKNKDLEDKYLRSQAEIQNAQRRYSKERADLVKYESQRLGKDILSSVDNLERALQVKADDEASRQLKKGIEMTLEGLVRALKDNGIEEIKADGEKFDPTLHQAVQSVPAENDDQKGHVVQVLQKGYVYKDRTLRPAMVVVAQ